MFGIFRSRTSAYYFSQDLKHGGAAYIPTGRGYALKHATFVKTYTSYGRSHIYYAVTVRRRRPSAQHPSQCRVQHAVCRLVRKITISSLELVELEEVFDWLVADVWPERRCGCSHKGSRHDHPQLMFDTACWPDHLSIHALRSW